LDGNDVSLEDRKKEIYPNNITLCKSNCIYKGVDLENQRVICNCNINNKTNDKVEVQDNENFVAYTIDYINYKLFLCYKLFFNAYYIRHSYAFFIILLIFVITLIFDFTFLNYTLENLKKYLIKQMPSYNKFYKDIFKEEKQCEENIDNMNIIINDGIIANPLKKELAKNKNKLNKSKTKNKRHNPERVFYSKAINGKFEEGPVKTEEPFKEEIKKGKKAKRLEKRRNSKRNSTRLTQLPSEKIKKTDNKDDEKKEEENINDLPYTKALELDKRNILHVYVSFLLEKLDFINCFCTSNKIKIILFVEYILSLLINFFFNALLYSDEVVSHKYHNNGNLDILVSFVLSILSNIVTSIICSYLQYSKGIDDKIDLILEIKYDKHYFRNVKRFYLYLKLKFICFFIAQIIVFATCIYYIEIFCVKYHCSQMSLLLNFCYSFIESIITSFALVFIIVLTRKIGLSCSNKELYNTSKYINNKT
jgi:hypothetical protein